MALLDNEAFELGGFNIGPAQQIACTNLTIDPGDSRSQDQDSPVGDTRAFGRDMLTAGTWSLDLLINTQDAVSASAAYGALVKAWRADSTREIPGRQTTLRYGAAGRTRRVYGRPRGIPTLDPNGITTGAVTASAKFVLGDTLTYDDLPQILQITAIAPSTGGLIFPATFPVTTIPSTTRSGVINNVGGDAPTPFEVEFHGPISNPVALINGTRIALATTIAYDQWVTVNTRELTVLRNDGANLSGALSRTTYLDDCRLSPGAAELQFSGSDATGTATCKLTWRPAYYGF